MKFTRDWLFSHLETDRPLVDILDGLPMLGLEVESVVNRAVALAPLTARYHGILTWHLMRRIYARWYRAAPLPD